MINKKAYHFLNVLENLALLNSYIQVLWPTLESSKAKMLWLDDAEIAPCTPITSHLEMSETFDTHFIFGIIIRSMIAQTVLKP